MKRYLLTLEYDGTAYSGWQRQLYQNSVQAEVERALFTATRVHTALTGASRTDAGVHALGQRAHFDTNASIPEHKWPYVLNTLLPKDIRVTECRLVGDTFHARFSARRKAYEYRIYNRRHHSALLRNFAAFVPLPLDEGKMNRALLPLLGTHDFAAFQASGGTAKTTIRTIFQASVTRRGDELILLIEGDAFLYNMVRIIAGTLIAVGQNKLDTDVFERAISTGDRLVLGATAPACGLTLKRVWYEGEL